MQSEITLFFLENYTGCLKMQINNLRFRNFSTIVTSMTKEWKKKHLYLSKL